MQELRSSLGAGRSTFRRLRCANKGAAVRTKAAAVRTKAPRCEHRGGASGTAAARVTIGSAVEVQKRFRICAGAVPQELPADVKESNPARAYVARGGTSCGAVEGRCHPTGKGGYVIRWVTYPPFIARVRRQPSFSAAAGTQANPPVSAAAGTQQQRSVGGKPTPRSVPPQGRSSNGRSGESRAVRVAAASHGCHKAHAVRVSAEAEQGHTRPQVRMSGRALPRPCA
eukprot:5331938-Prymnesium_polylepis.1